MSVLLALVVASPTFAARRSSLSGNLLIQDTDDMFFFPQLVSMHKRLVTFDFGTSEGLGSGGLVFGNEQLTFGLFAHRSEFLGALDSAYFTRGDIDNISGDGAIDVGVGPNALNWIDVIGGWQAGGNPWGVRLSVGRNNVDPDPDNVQADATAFNVILGTRLTSMALDASVEFSYASAATDVAAGPTTQNTTESSPYHFGAGVRRTAMDETDALYLGYLGTISYTSAGVDFTPATGTATSSDNSAFNVQVGAGPVYHPNDRTNVAMYGTFEYQRAETEPTVGTTNTVTDMTIPGWNVAAELEVTSWLQFRSGLRSRFVFNSDKTETQGPPATEVEDKGNTLDYAWTTGVGLRFGGFQLDGFLDPSVITQGTDLLGESSDLFGLVTTSYHF
jgi:hypothetical protein